MFLVRLPHSTTSSVLIVIMKNVVMEQRVYGQIIQHVEKPRDDGCLIWRENNEILAGTAKGFDDCGGNRYE